MSENTYRVGEVAKKLNVSVRSVFRYIHDEKLRATKIGYWRVDENDLKSFVIGRTNVGKPMKK